MREIEFERHTFKLLDPEKDHAGVGKIQRATVFAEQALLDDMRARLRAGDLVIRIISARKANRKEETVYWKWR